MSNVSSAITRSLPCPHISYGVDRYLHEVAGEDLGLPFGSLISMDRSVTDIWSQDSWKARPGCLLMLAKLPSGGV